LILFGQRCLHPPLGKRRLLATLFLISSSKY